MLGETLVRLRDELLVKSLLRGAGFVARNQQDRSALRIKRERDPPHPVRRPETQLSHVGVLGAVQRVGMRPSELWSEFAQGDCRSFDVDFHLGVEGGEFLGERLMKADKPRHLLADITPA